MQQVHLADALYQEASNRARAAGFASVDAFIADVLRQDFAGTSDNLDGRFTPAVNAYLEAVASEMDTGKSLSISEIEDHLEDAKRSWRESRSS